MSPRIRRSAAAIAALGTAGTGIGLFTSSAEALPPPAVPATQYGPTAQLNLVVSSTATVPPIDHADANASATTAGTGAIPPTGYLYSCEANGTLSISSNTATGAQCAWPSVIPPPSPYPQRPMTVRATDSNGLQGTKQADFSSVDKGPNIVFTATAGTGPGEQRVVIDTAGSTSTNAPVTSISCGDGTIGVHDSGTLWHCDYATGGQQVLSLVMADSVTNLDSMRQARIYVIAKPVAALAVTQTSALNVSADITGSSVDPHFTGTYSLAWGDGTSSPVDPAVSTKATHTYTSAAHGVPTLTVTDDSVGVGTATATPGRPGVFRYAGQNRYQTGIDVSGHSWDALTDVAPGARHPQAVVLARGDGYADALAGVPLAAKKKGPLLLTPTAALDPGVQAEIQRILPTTGPTNTVYILGGLSAVSQNVENQLTALGYHVVRFGGNDRFATALKIATDPNAMNDPARVVVATGYNFPDALSAGPYASLPSVDGAIVLSQDNAFDAATGTFVTAKLGAGGNVTAVGGQARTAVSALPGSAGHFASFVGGDRYATAAMVAGLGGTSAFEATAPVGVATGVAFPDSLTGGAMMAQLGGPMLLTDPHGLSTATGTQLTALKPTTLEADIFGGSAALLPATTDAVVATVNGIKHFS